MKTKFVFKRVLTLVLAVMMLVTAMPVGVLADPGAAGTQNKKKYTDDDYSITYNDKIIRKADYINKVDNLPIEPVKTKNAETLVKYPKQPERYTVRADFKVERGDDYIISYQPYIATVGEGASYTEKAKVKKELKFPEFDGYTSATKKTTVDYNFVKSKADKGKDTDDPDLGTEKKGPYEAIYKPVEGSVLVRHYFQNFDNPEVYGEKPGDEKGHFRETTQTGLTGTSLRIQPLPDHEIEGYVPESNDIKTQVPENPKGFVVEFRYNRASYDLVYDTDGGTPIPSRRVYYKQVIPKLSKNEIPTKEGCEFIGWKASHDIEDTNGNKFKAGEIIKNTTGEPIKNLDANLLVPALKLENNIRPAEKLIFTAVWKDKEKADYALQFWVEKSDHDDNANLAQKYEYMGTHVYHDQPTGTRPDLAKEPVNGIVFPDLDKTRLEKIWNEDKFNQDTKLFLNKFFVYNKDLTDKENADPKNTNLVKAVNANGKTVYNIYYDRQVYDLYFTKSNHFVNQYEDGVKGAQTFYPEIWGLDENNKQVMLGGPGKPYHFTARFNEHMKKWPNDAMQTKGFTPGYQSYGWGPNYGVPEWPVHLDTPPYRLNADEFLDMEWYESKGGYTNNIDAGNGVKIPAKDFRTLSFGIKQGKNSIPHHMDLWMDGFKDGETIVRYDLYRSKADTDQSNYQHRAPKVQGFEAKYASQTTTLYDENGLDDINDERDKITPIPDKEYKDIYGFKHKIGQINFILAFFNNADSYGDPKEGEPFETNGYLRFKYTRKKYPLRFNYDPSITRDDNEFSKTNSIDTFYEFPLKALSPDLVDDSTPQAEREYFKDNPANLLDNPNNLYKLGLYDLLEVDKNKLEKLSKADKDLFKNGKLDKAKYDSILLKVKEKIKVKNEATGKEEGKEIETYKVKRPEGLSPQMIFKGWALDPAGTKLIWENSHETMPSHPVNIYAHWAEPDYKWKITFDPNGGKMPDLKAKNITSEQKKIKEGDIGFEKEVTYPLSGYKNEDGTEIGATVNGKKIFTVIQRQKLVPPEIPSRKGYEFMGWELVRFKKDDQGNLELDQDKKPIEDKSYRTEFNVPELYSFDNDVVSDLYLRAIWNKNDLIDIKSYHHFLDKDYKEVSRQEQVLQNRRVGSYVGAVGSRQNAERILVPKDEWKDLEEKNETNIDIDIDGSMTYRDYMRFDPVNPRVNSYYQQIIVKPEKIQDPAHPDDPTQLIPNPDAKYNVFHFYYRPFRHREYKVNYLDERGRKEVEEFIEQSKKAFKDIKDSTTLDDKGKIDAYKKLLEKNRTKFEAIRKKYAIIDQEAVKNGKRHFDARNYRPIAGWVLDDKPQQQLFFDIDEDTNAFFGINETGFDEINFFYKDVRVVEVPGDKEPPKGYVRVTFKAADGGSFTDKDGKAVKELYYDVVKGLRSQLLPVPKNPVEESKKEKGKYYITPDNGKNFTKWDKSQLLNENTIIEKDYTFTAQYDWSDLKVSSKGLVSTESFIDPDDKWTNEFAPSIDELKNQLVLTKNNKVINNIDEHIVAQLFDEKGKELKTDEDVLKLLSEQNKSDTEELVRRVNIKAKVKFKDEKYKDLENAAEGLAGEIAKLKAEIEQNKKKITELNKKIADKEAEKENLNTGDPDYQAKFAALEQEIAAMRTEIENLKTQNNAKNEEINTKNNEIKTKTAEINKLKDELSKLKADEAAKQTEIASKEAGLKPLEKQLRELNEKILVDSAEFNNLKAEGKLTANEIAKKEADIKTLKDQAKNIENQINSIKNELSTLKAEVAAKQEPIAKKEAGISSKEKEIWNKADAIKAYEAGLTEQVLDIPVTIYKNVYEALTKTEKPLFLSEAEKGDLKDITGDYVKVTVQPTNKPTNKDAKIYYVNPYAWVKISEVDISQDASSLGFTKWTADKDKQNEKDKKGKSTGVFDFTKRHMFTEDTVITPDFSDDVVRQTDPNKKPDVPNDFVKVIVEKTEKAELKTGEEQTQTFWVNPNKEVTIPVAKPTGKTEAAAEGQQAKAYMFEKWTSEETPARTWEDKIVGKFEKETTITANYTEATNIIPYNPDEPKERPDGYVRVKFEAEEGLTLSNVKYYYVKQNSGVKLSDLKNDTTNYGYPTVNEKTGYKFEKWDKDDTTEIGSDPITVTAKAERLKPAIPDDGKPGTKPKGYLEVEFVINTDDKTKGNLEGVIKYFVKPNEYVPLNPPKTTANTGYEFGAWDKDTTIPTIYNEDTIITGSFNGLNDVIKKVDDQTKKPEGYVTVKFELEELDGKIAGNFAHGEITEYFVNPNKEVTIEPPKTSANTGYVFKEWDKDTTTATTYTTPTTVKGSFTKLDDIIPSKDSSGKDNAKPEDYVTVTFTKGAHGSAIEGQTIFYVNPTANKTIADIKQKPTVTPDTGYKQNGWDKADGYPITKDTTVNAKYDDFDNVIPKFKDDGVTTNYIPNGYIEVTFDPTDKATDPTKKVVYVRPNTAVALKGYEPKVEAKPGYDFSSWDVDLTLPTIYSSPRTIKAKYNSDNDISKAEKPGYVKVEFKTDPDKGTLKGDTKLWVKPNTQVILPTPIVIANAGHKFTGWKESLTVNLPKGSQTYVINAQYDNADNIIPKIDSSGKTNAKPDGYVTVTFRADVNGKLEDDKEEIVYFVNPDAGVKLVDTVKDPNKEIAIPNVIADKNYELDKWYESIDKDNSITTDLEYVARFNKGKVTLTYDAGEGTGTPPITVIVDNGTKVRLASATGLTKADASFKGWSIDGSTDLKQDGDEITLTKDTKAVAQWTTDKDIIEYDPVNNPTTRPDDTYVRVTFEADNGLTLTEQKAYYVKKNAGKIIEDLTKPGKTAETGYEFKKWDKENSTEIKTDIVVKALAKPIGDAIENKSGTQKPDGYVEVKFVAGENGSVEEKSYFVNPNKYVTLTPPTKKANTGFEFGAWSPDPSVPRLYKDQVTKITANFNKLNAVIPKTKDDDSEKPAGYVTVTFEIEGKGGSIAPKETIVYYVKPNTKVTINPPKTIAKTGYKFNGWDIITKDVSFDKDKTIKGSFTQLKDIIPKEENGTINAQPDGYIKVTFDKGDHGKEITGQTVYYVNPEADPAKTLGDQTIVKPEVKSEVGYKFTGWDTPDTTEINKPKDIVVKAQYEALPDVIVKTADDDSQKPEDYITVTFDTTNKGRIKYTSMITKKVLFVNPNKAIVLKDKAPGVVPKKGYEFSRWDVSIDQEIKYKDGTTITALYNEPGDISTKEVYGYVKVEFKQGEHGSLQGQTTEYWIKPGVEVNIPEPKVDPNVGFKFKKWDKSLTVTANAGDPTYEITAEYEELANIIPQKNTDESDKPKDYVTIKFEAVHGTLKGTLVYYVNPNKDIMLLSTGESIIDKADTGYTKEYGTWSEAVSDLKKYTEDKIITYTFAPLKDVIEKIKDDQDAPDGYVTVTLDPTDNAKDKTKKVYFVNPLKKVTLPEFKPTGKEDKDAIGNKFTYVFNVWTSIKGVYGVWSNPNGKIEGIFTQDTDIEARYTKTSDLPPIAKKGAITQINVMPKPEDLITNVYDKNDPNNKENLPDGTTFEYTTDGKPDVSKLGLTTAKVKVTYPNGNTVTVEVPITVVKSVGEIEYYPEDVIPFDPTDLDNPNNPIKRPEGFIKVTFEADAGIRLTEPKAYYVRKKAKDKKGNPLKLSALQKPSYELAQGYGFGNWDDDTITIGESDIVVRARANRVVKPDDKPSYPEVIYRDKIVEKEKIVEKIVKVGENDELLKEIRYMQGYNGKFRPYDGLTRAEAAQILANALKADGYRYDANYAISYSDVGSKWYTDAVRVVTQAGVFQGYSDGTFRPQGKITRAEWVATLRRFQDLKEASGNTMMLRSNHWATAEVEAAYEAGWLGVYQDGTAKFDADKPITRQEVAYVSNRAFRRVLDKVYLKRSVNTLLTYKDINPSMPLYEDILCASNTLLTDNRYYKANTVVLDNLTFNIVTDYLRIQQKKFQYNVIR